jgi:hypothetical protein
MLCKFRHDFLFFFPFCFAFCYNSFALDDCIVAPAIRMRPERVLVRHPKLNKRSTLWTFQAAFPSERRQRFCSVSVAFEYSNV